MASYELLDRARGEFAEMPGLRLTIAQAARLWAVERPVCGAVLDALVKDRFLFRTRDGAYMMWPTARPATAHMRRGPQTERSA